MAAGLPVVSFDSKNNRNILGDAGIYAYDDKVENLAEKIIWAVENTKEVKELGVIGKKRVELLFSWDKIIKNTANAFDILISKQNKYKCVPILYYPIVAITYVHVEDIFVFEFLPVI